MFLLYWVLRNMKLTCWTTVKKVDLLEVVVPDLYEANLYTAKREAKSFYCVFLSKIFSTEEREKSI